MAFLYCLLITLRYFLIPMVLVSIYVAYKNRNFWTGLAFLLVTTIISGVFGGISVALVSGDLL